MTSRRVLVCGGRDFGNADLLNRVLNREHELCEIDLIIHGGCSGADELADRWARSTKGPSLRTFKANWASYGKAAGPIRNERMLEEGKPTVVIAFPGGAGTANMIALARAARVRVIEIGADG